MTTPALFRVWNEKPFGVIALLPSVPARQPWHITSYEMDVGFADASPAVYTDMTRPAERDERKKIERELREKYPDLEVIQHLPRKGGNHEDGS